MDDDSPTPPGCTPICTASKAICRMPATGIAPPASRVEKGTLEAEWAAIAAALLARLRRWRSVDSARIEALNCGRYVGGGIAMADDQAAGHAPPSRNDRAYREGDAAARGHADR